MNIQSSTTVFALTLTLFAQGCVRNPGANGYATPSKLFAAWKAAAVSGDSAALNRCLRPQDRRLFRDYLTVRSEFSRKADLASILIEDRFGAETARYFHAKAMGALIFGSRSAGQELARENLTVKGNELFVEKAGEVVLRGTRQRDGRWYVFFPEPDALKGGLAMATGWLKEGVAQVDTLTGKLEKGSATRRDVAYMFVSSEGLPADLRRKESVYGPECDGVKIGIELGSLIVGLQDGTYLSFQVNVDHDGLRPVCFFVPRRSDIGSTGIGRNVIVELDGVPLPQQSSESVVPCRLGYGGGVSSFPVMVTGIPPLTPGEHTIRYSIICQGGTYKDSKGNEYTVLQGPLESNLLTFTVKGTMTRPIDQVGAHE